MKEAVGNTFILSIMITFVVIFIILFAGSTSYTKAYKVKNRIIDIIENNEDVKDNKGISDSTFTEINQFLSETGYKIGNPNKSTCKSHGGNLVSNHNNRYRYCIERFETDRGPYYGVTAYMYLELPVISSLIEIPVYGETKILGQLKAD